MAPTTPATKRHPAAQLPEGVLEVLRPRIPAPVPAPVPQPHPASGKSEARGTPVIARQTVQTSTIPSTYGSLYNSLGPGEIVGIVLGSVAGFVLILWLLYACINAGNPSGTDDKSSVVTRKSRRAHRHSHHHHSARPRSATVEIRTTTRGPAIVEEMSLPDEAIIVEERRRRSVSRGPRVMAVGSDEDEVVVIEEAGPPRARRHRSTSVRRSVERRSSGYREVDPDRFAGGDAPMREIRRSTSRRRYS